MVNVLLVHHSPSAATAQIAEAAESGLRLPELGDIDVTVSRTGYTGEIGYEIYVHKASGRGVRRGPPRGAARRRARSNWTGRLG